MSVALTVPQLDLTPASPVDHTAETARSLSIEALALLDQAGSRYALAACSVSLAVEQLPFPI